MIVEVSMSAIDCSDSFFDSFRGFYPTFDDWFARQSDAGRHAFLHWGSDGRTLDGFMCVKIEDTAENYSDFEKPFDPGVRLKICSLKSTANGTGLGRTLIGKAMDIAKESNVDGIYLTVYAGTPDTDRLIRRIVDMGFRYRCHKDGECVYECSVLR
jgi:GNAT superfamily N-acetyltransferase